MDNFSKLYYLSQFPTDELYRRFVQRPSVDTSEIKRFQAVSPTELLVTYNNGERVLYYSLENWAARPIHYESDALTEEQHRKEFRIILKNKMLMKGMTQKELAEKIGINQSTVSKYIAGTALPGYAILKKIADALNCTVEDLYLVF